MKYLFLANQQQNSWLGNLQIIQNNNILPYIILRGNSTKLTKHAYIQ
jgi:hypothetical protein